MFDYYSTTSIRCVMWACDDIFLLTDPKCSVTHSLDGCCANGVVCPPFENVATCDFNGQKYHEGKRFYPTNSCHKCICQKGFTGKIETPFCARLTCGVQLKWSSATKPKEYCAPFYGNVSKNDALCCPEDWICRKFDQNFQ
ncbi:hypothetical protein BDFB_013128 [Asbolus verrucosus]|uniref:VWFC domain-containing protein n=1 Tax=Asbolus verrucosus TaxID=1661398 RepID=A0A482VG80_ASBVE|nr:hypothetical protein BDFB_013128 [Asbolus verrucosus]